MDCGGEEQARQNGHGGDPAEWKKVAELRAVVEAQDPAAKITIKNSCIQSCTVVDVDLHPTVDQPAHIHVCVCVQEEDDFMLRRFLHAREQNINKASSMFLKYLSWKGAAKPHGSITEAEVRGELVQDKLYVQGFDKVGRPMIYLFGNRHFAAKRDLEEFKRYVVYILDNTCTKLPAGQEKFASVVDLKGWGYANCDIRAKLAALEIMQNYYPERLGRVFLIHVPYVFMAAWKMVYPFIDDNTKKKFVFVADKDLDATLRDAIDVSQLPEQYGGKLRLEGYKSSSSPPS